MTDDDVAVSSLDAGYVPCPDLAAAEPDTADDDEAVTGFDEGYVEDGGSAAAGPDTSDDGVAAAGFDAGYVANPCGCGITDTFQRVDTTPPVTGTNLGTADCGVAWTLSTGAPGEPTGGGDPGGHIQTSFGEGVGRMDDGLGVVANILAYLPCRIPTFPVSMAVVPMNLTTPPGLPMTLFFGCMFNAATIQATLSVEFQIGGFTTLTVSDGVNSASASFFGTPTLSAGAPYPAATFGWFAATLVNDATTVTFDGGGVHLVVDLTTASPSPIATPLVDASEPFIGTNNFGAGDPGFDDLDIAGLNACTPRGDL